MNKAKVSIVGAGPGDPDLITLKGLKAIQQADVVLYDALATEELLTEARADANLIYVGKRCGQHSLKQTDINALIVQQAKIGKHVVRLKGGDPFVFGRGHEELHTIRKNHIDVEVIPGISTATSLPLLQEVPVTRRNVSESFWVLTGTTKDHQLSKDIELAVQSTATLVILMATRKMSEIGALMVKYGKGETPFMVIQNGSLPNEHVVTGYGHNMANATARMRIGEPGIIVIGEVVNLRKQDTIQKVNAQWTATT